MKINKSLVLQENKFFPSTRNKTFLIRILFERIDETDKEHTLIIPFKDIREEFGTDVRQKFINRLLDEIMDTTFIYNGKEYKYIESYTNHFDDRYYTITFPAETIAIWLKNAIVYDFHILKDLRSNKTSIILYEYFLTDATTLPLCKFYDIFNRDGYDFFHKRRELDKAVDIINNYSDIRVIVEYNRDLDTFLITKK